MKTVCWCGEEIDVVGVEYECPGCGNIWGLCEYCGKPHDSGKYCSDCRREQRAADETISELEGM